MYIESFTSHYCQNSFFSRLKLYIACRLMLFSVSVKSYTLQTTVEVQLKFVILSFSCCFSLILSRIQWTNLLQSHLLSEKLKNETEVPCSNSVPGEAFTDVSGHRKCTLLYNYVCYVMLRNFTFIYCDSSAFM